MKKFLVPACLCFLLMVPVITFAQVVPVDVDIKPGSCPNPFSGKSHGVTPVAILGSETYDVTSIDITDPTSFTLAGVPAETDPAPAVVACAAWIEDEVLHVTSDPSAPPNTTPEDCDDCFEDGDALNEDLLDAEGEPGSDGVDDTHCADGYADLVLYFDTQLLATAMGAVERGDCVTLPLIQTIGGVPVLLGSDTVIVKHPPKPAPSSTSLATCWASLKTE
ncbi:hypothetical protein ACFL6S_01820 [Candidatus Poribacteria bacterium]